MIDTILIGRPSMVASAICKAGGVAKEFHTIAVGDGIAMGHGGMLYSLSSREVIADAVEYMVRSLSCTNGCGRTRTRRSTRWRWTQSAMCRGGRATGRNRATPALVHMTAETDRHAGTQISSGSLVAISPTRTSVGLPGSRRQYLWGTRVDSSLGGRS